MKEILKLMIAEKLNPRKYLTLLLCSEGNKRMNELARELSVSTAGTTNIVDDLEQLRFVKRVSSPGDRRCWEIQITQKGRLYLGAVREAMAA